MNRKFVPVFLIILSLSAIMNIGLAWWPGSWHMPTVAREFRSQRAYAAEQKAKSPQPATMENTKKRQSETNLVTAAEASIFPGNPKDNPSHEEIETLRSLRSVKKQLDARAKVLDERQQSIERSEAGIAKRVGELEDLLAKIRGRLKQEESIKNKKIKRLTAVYASMKPQKSAQVLSRMQLPIVVKMFSRMDEKKVGKILSFLPPEKAVRITQALTRQISSLNKM